MFQWPPKWWVRRHCDHTDTVQSNNLKPDDDGLLYYEVHCANPRCGKLIEGVYHESCAPGDIML